jgi:O-acetyl-ADP-ribose deacetylase (regulator of RNase III)/ADP-ribose pyrophosphatase YjhB (NUDIX family)
MKIKNTEFKIIKDDITQLETDAIVNAANNKLLMGGGVAGAIRRRGGKVIEEEALRKGPIEIGEAIYTSAGSLKAKYVIHAATMGMDFKTDEVKIRNSCASSLRVAETLKIRSIAFPALGCGVGGFPLLAAAKIMAQEVFKHIRQNESNLSEIIFCLYNNEAYNIFEHNAARYIEYIQNKLQQGPFCTVDVIIELEQGIILIERSNPPLGFALPGGFVDYAESLEDAVRREAKEETNMDLVQLKQFHTYSDPNRDPRFHTIGTVFIAKARGNPEAGDDAKGLKIVRYEDLLKFDYAFDHKKIIQDYLDYKKNVDKKI